VRRSANTSGDGSDKLSKTLISPRFSATKIRPSAANWTAVGLVRPLRATVSRKPGGSVAAAAVGVGLSDVAPTTSVAATSRTVARGRAPARRMVPMRSQLPCLPLVSPGRGKAQRQVRAT
jgi:hypothetical protein